MNSSIFLTAVSRYHRLFGDNPKVLFPGGNTLLNTSLIGEFVNAAATEVVDGVFVTFVNELDCAVMYDAAHSKKTHALAKELGVKDRMLQLSSNFSMLFLHRQELKINCFGAIFSVDHPLELAGKFLHKPGTNELEATLLGAAPHKPECILAFPVAGIFFLAALCKNQPRLALSKRRLNYASHPVAF